ncbi:MAG: hypothetical protein WA952_01435 [Lewinella sp.]
MAFCLFLPGLAVARSGGGPFDPKCTRINSMYESGGAFAVARSNVVNVREVYLHAYPDRV